MSLPNVEHTTAAKTPLGATEVTANDGYVFYDRANYEDYTDENGNPCEVPAEEICYFRYIVFGKSVTAEEIESRLVVVPESEVPADQIFGTPPQIM